MSVSKVSVLFVSSSGSGSAVAEDTVAVLVNESPSNGSATATGIVMSALDSDQSPSKSHVIVEPSPAQLQPLGAVISSATVTPVGSVSTTCTSTASDGPALAMCSV